MKIPAALIITSALLVGCTSSPDAIQRVTPILSTNTSAAAAMLPSPTPSMTEPPTQGATAAASATRSVNTVPTPETGVMATAAPLTTSLPPGLARSIAQATDTLLQPTARTPIAFANDETVSIAFDEFYDGFSIRYGLQLSDKLVSLDGRSIAMEGYMAPPLKPELDYFVLTRVRLAFCPFCSSAGDWPDDIALVYMPEGVTTLATSAPVRIIGRMEIGQSVDQETGMVSLVRIYADRMETIG